MDKKEAQTELAEILTDYVDDDTYTIRQLLVLLIKIMVELKWVKK